MKNLGFEEREKVD